jgi:aminoglycoside phosphotransferase (APT) family kinase protein
VNDAPFYVMGFVDGHVIRDRAAAERTLDVAGRRRASESIVDTMAAIHAVDLDAVGLADLGKHEGYIARQLKRWYGQWNAQKTRELPAVDRVHDALLQRIPEQGPASIVHGDYRLDNCMVGDDGQVIAVLDWEICTLGDPMADLGLLQVYWTGPGDEPSAWTGSSTTAAGFLDRADLVQRYAEVSGRDISELPFYVSFAYWKLACILEGVYARYLGGALGERDAAELEPFRLQVEGAAAKALDALQALGTD